MHSPLLRSLDEQTLRALAVPFCWSGETTIWNTSPSASSSEDVGVGTHHQLGEHATGRHAGDVDLAGISVVLPESPFDHVDNGKRVTSAIVGQAGSASDIPALGRSWSGWEDDDITVDIGIVCILGTREEVRSASYVSAVAKLVERIGTTELSTSVCNPELIATYQYTNGHQR